MRIEVCLDFSGFVNSLYVYNDGRDARFEEVDDDSTFVGTLSSPYVLYQNTYSDVYVSKPALL